MAYVYGFYEVASFAWLFDFFCLRGSVEEEEGEEVMQGCNAKGRGAS